MAADTALIAYIRKLEARAARMYDEWRGDDSLPWKELPPRDRHDWIIRAKSRSLV